MHQYRTIMLTFPNMPIYTLKVLTVVQLCLNDDLKYKTRFAIPIVLSLNLKFLYINCAHKTLTAVSTVTFGVMR